MPCPFCGGTQIETKEGSTFRWRLAFCANCEAACGEVRVVAQNSEQAHNDVMAAWNERHHTTQEQP
jgi:Lar family restriction alleviation protein